MLTKQVKSINNVERTIRRIKFFLFIFFFVCFCKFNRLLSVDIREIPIFKYSLNSATLLKVSER